MAKNWRAAIANVMSLIVLAIAGSSKQYHFNKGSRGCTIGSPLLEGDAGGRGPGCILPADGARRLPGLRARLSKQPGVLSWPNNWPGTRTTRNGILMNRGQAEGKASSPGSRATPMPDGRQTHKEALGAWLYRLPGCPAFRHTSNWRRAN